MELNCTSVNTSCISSSKCGGVLERAVYPQNIGELEYFAKKYSTEEYVILGAMTNTLLLDGYCGIGVFSDLMKGVSVNGNFITVKSGESLSKICGIAQYSGLSGMENLFGIPGTVGGAVAGNSGCFGTEVSDIINSVTVFKLDTGETEILTRDEIAFGYRYCNLRKDKDFIVSVKFELFPSNCMKIAQRMAYVRSLRREKQPIGKSLGSYFKQYNGVSAGYYIEQAGLKGYTANGIAVSDKHANFIMNYGGNAKEYVALAEYVRKKVAEETGVRLEREVNIIGEEGRQRDSYK